MLRIFHISAVFALTLSLISCDQRRTVDRASEEKVLLLGNGDEPKELDPQVVTGVIESNIINALFEGLCVRHPENEGVHLPGMAERWEANADFTQWTFHLRNDAKWSDGTPLTAADFLFAFERILTPEFGAKYAEMLYYLKGAQQFHQGESDDFSSVSVRAPDPHTLELELVAPTPFLPDLTMHYTWFPVPKHCVLSHGEMQTKHNPWTRPQHIVSNGPFQLTSWKFNQYIAAEANPNYWDAARLKLKGIKFLPIKNAYTEARMFFDGQLHGTYTLAPEMIRYAKDTEPESLRQEPYFASYFLRCNVTSPAVQNPKIRRALALAIDRQAIIDKILQGGQSAAYSVTPPIGEYQPPKAIEYKLSEAKALLKEAGFGPDNPLRLKLLATDRDSTKRICEAVQAMWKQELGVDCTIVQFEWKTYLDKLTKLQYDVCFGGWSADYPDPTTFLDMWKKGGGNNRTGWFNNDYDQQLKTAAQCSDPAERFRLLERAEATMMDELPSLPLFWATTNYLLSPQVQGWHPLLLNQHPYKFIDLTQP
ncbi:peptide ABC transporter substrate-binding protein [Rubritalea marina]|uniref:peptide ABC transporter substrate-binding protein n=1 Tax=Rubritalea marina TaxID=361055 RepID=UPI000378D042|nr:peptide ABC transporter substrate-binding protein [Rubritalea marina]